MIGSLESDLTRTIDLIGQSRQLLVGLDFDGTLTPIVDDPHSARLPKETRHHLEQLVSLPGVYVAILSGRSLDDLHDRIAINGLIYAGNHGMDISGPGLRFIEPVAAQQHDRMAQLAHELQQALADHPGVEIERKALTLSIHHRRAVPEVGYEAGQVVMAKLKNSSTSFRLTLGKMVYEVRPNVDWHKGRALEWIRSQTVATDAPVLYGGDDETDEDVFHFCPNSISIRVGRTEDTSARFQLDTPSEMQSLLERLVGCLKERT